MNGTERAIQLIRADERERLANEAYERGDIGTATGPDAWAWLLSASAATATPKRRLRINFELAGEETA